MYNKAMRVLEDIPLNVSGVYMIVCVPTKQFYIGSSKNIYSRMMQHIKDLAEGKHHNYKLQILYKAHGLSNFSFHVLEECEIVDLFTREQAYLDDSAANLKMLNISKFADTSKYKKRRRRAKSKSKPKTGKTKTKKKENKA